MQSKYLNTGGRQGRQPAAAIAQDHRASPWVLGKRLTWPDDYFILRQTLGYQNYDLNNYDSGGRWSSTSRNGTSNVLSYRSSSRANSIDQPFFARSGSNISFIRKGHATMVLLVEPRQDLANPLAKQLYQWAEFHKWKFTTAMVSTSSRTARRATIWC